MANSTRHKLAPGAMDGLLKVGVHRALHIPGRPRSHPSSRTATDLAEELGISTQRLSNLLKRDDAPRVSLVRLVRGKERHYFVRSEVLRWYRALTDPRTPTEPPAAAEGGA